MKLTRNYDFKLKIIMIYVKFPHYSNIAASEPAETNGVVLEATSRV